MGTFEFKLPDIGEGVVEGEIVEWHVATGDKVTEDQPLVDMMTDKATVMIPSSVNGTVTELAGVPGDMIPVGSTLIILTVDGEGSEEEEKPVEEVEGHPEKSEVVVDAENKEKSESPPAPVTRSASRGIRASPAVRRRATKAGIDLTQITGTGPAGRITQDDLDAIESGEESKGEQEAPAPQTKREKV